MVKVIKDCKRKFLWINIGRRILLEVMENMVVEIERRFFSKGQPGEIQFYKGQKFWMNVNNNFPYIVDDTYMPDIRTINCMMGLPD